MRLEWTKEEDGIHTAAFDLDGVRGTVSMRATHDPVTMQWHMKGRITGLGKSAIVIRQAVPDTDPVESALDVFRRTCEYDLLIHMAEVRS